MATACSKEEDLGYSDTALDTIQSSCYSASQHHTGCLRIKSKSTLSNHSLPQKTGKVRFDKVEIRLYPIILSDNPSTSSGPPISLGWSYDPNDTVISDVDSYEFTQDEPGVRRTRMQLIIPPGVREESMLETGYSPQEIKSAARQVEKDKQRRYKSLRKQQIESFILTKAESAKNGFKNRFATRRRSEGSRPFLGPKRDSLLLVR